MTNLNLFAYVLFLFIGAILPFFMLNINGMRYLLLHNIVCFLTAIYIAFLMETSTPNHYVFSITFMLITTTQLLYYAKVLSHRKDWILLAGLQIIALTVFLCNKLWMKQVLLSALMIIFFYFILAIASVWFIWRLIIRDDVDNKKKHLLIGSNMLIFYSLLALTESSTFSVFEKELYEFNGWFNAVFEIAKVAVLVKIMADKK